MSVCVCVCFVKCLHVMLLSSKLCFYSLITIQFTISLNLISLFHKPFSISCFLIDRLIEELQRHHLIVTGVPPELLKANAEAGPSNRQPSGAADSLPNAEAGPSTSEITDNDGGEMSAEASGEVEEW